MAGEAEEIIPGSITFELSDEDIQAIKNGARTVTPKKLVGGEGGFAIRNHSFANEKITLYVDTPSK